MWIYVCHVDDNYSCYMTENMEIGTLKNSQSHDIRIENKLARCFAFIQSRIVSKLRNNLKGFSGEKNAILISRESKILN